MFRASQRMFHRRKPKVYLTEGRCIYCGNQDDPGSLTREHVIPEGLGGGLLFLKASCKKCEKVTGQFEQECLRTNFSVYRTIAKFPSSRPPLKTPRGLCLPRLPRPGLLVGRPPGADLICDGAMIWSGFTPGEAPERGPFAFNFVAFIRMLAKIAHGYAVGELGMDSFSHMLPDVILWKRPELAQTLVGLSDHPYARLPDNQFVAPQVIESDPMYAAHETYFKVLTRETDYLVLIGVRLFAAHGAPFYECIAGPLLPKGCARLGLPLRDQNA